MRRYIFLFLLVFPSVIHAGELRLVPDSLPIREGEPASFTVYANTENETINASETTVLFDEDFLTFTNAKDNDSSILFWITRPEVCNNSEVCFSGISPGGFAGENEKIASLIFTPKQSGTTTLSLPKARMLLHDGKGTDIPVQSQSLQVFIEKRIGAASTGDSLEIVDTEPPEVFSPKVVTHPDVYDGKYVLIFDTKDKQTSVVAYYVKEYTFPGLSFLARWHKADSPYILRDQLLQSTIEVKAIDEEGNERVMTLLAENPPNYSFVWWVTLFILLGCFVGILLRKKHILT